MKMIIEGNPIAQARMKFSGRNEIARIYDPREKQKRVIKSIIKEKFGDHDKFHHPCISFIFHMVIPRSTRRRDLITYESGNLKHEKKPDIDNFIKLYLDCMDTILFDGDQKVQLGTCVKLYHPIAKTIIIVNEMQQLLCQTEFDNLAYLGHF